MKTGKGKRNSIKTGMQVPDLNKMAWHPNAVHLLSSRDCWQLVLINDGKRVVHLSEYFGFEGSEEKEEDLFRFALLDYFSGVFFFRYYRDQSIHSFLDFLYRAWQVKVMESIFPFHGVPRILYAGKDFNLDEAEATRFSKTLHLELRIQQPGCSRALISAVQLQTWLEKIEAMLNFIPVYDLEGLNLWAFLKAMEINSKYKHSRHGGIRFKKWKTISEEALRYLPDGKEFFAIAEESDTESELD